MGKSSKKAKSDRINALRKQYDAFLEEDKKRKERNDFILGRLDKMRYTTALVPVRHKPSAFDTRPAVVSQFQPEFSSVHDFQSSITNQRQLFPDIQVNNNEETYLIQEISKKYILIPKLRTTFMNNSMRNGTTDLNPERLQEMHLDQDSVPVKDLKPNSHDKTDWKSKYDILNILKNEEKGKPTGTYQTDFVDRKQTPKESFLGNNQDQVAMNYDNYVNTDVHVETPTKYVNEFPEKDLPADTLDYDLPKDSEYSLINRVHAREDLVANAEKSENNNTFAVEQTDAIGDQLQNITLQYKSPDSPNIDVSQQITNYYEPQPEPDVNMTSTIADVCTKQIVHINEEHADIQDEYPVEAGSLIHGQNVSVEQHETADSEQVAYVDGNEISPMQALNYNEPSTLDVNDRIFENANSAIVSNDQEFAPNIDVQLKTDASDIPQEQTYLNSNIETAEEAEPVIEQQVNITESIEDFDAEQREMFYSEQTDDNYPTQQGDMEHPLDFSQNEYPQNQEYAYYENTEAEAYPGELHDEEATQQYDPSYDQQYAGLDQGSEQQQYVEQYQEPPERFTDQVEPEFEVLEYEQQFESQGAIEETLDVEDGYTAPKSEAPAVDMPPGEEPIEIIKSDDKTVPHVMNTSEQIIS